MASRDKQLLVRATADELQRWQDAADAAGVSRSAWVRAALDDGAERGLVGIEGVPAGWLRAMTQQD